MANGKDKIQKVIKDLKKQLSVVYADIEDLVTTASESYAELKGTITPKEVADIVVEVVLPKVKLPWYVPEFVVRIVVERWVEKVLKGKA